FQAEDGIRDFHVTGVQTCALPIYGKLDYLKLVNARDGGVNGVKIVYEECETAYATDRGVECYERLKAKNGGASGFDTQSTGITFAVSDKAVVDKVPVETMGYGLSQSVRSEEHTSELQS